MKTITIIAALLSLASHAGAQVVRSTANGISCLSSTGATVQEVGAVRAPASVPCPFSTTAAAAWGIPHEVVFVEGETTYCYWRFQAGPDAHGTVSFIVAAGTPIGSVTASGTTLVTVTSPPPMTACDYDWDGVLRVYDFISFLNDWAATGGFDYNKDGAVDSADWAAFNDACGG